MTNKNIQNMRDVDGKSVVSGYEANLEGDVDVPLAVLVGNDMRQQLPRELFRKKPLLFIAKFFLAISIIVAASLVILYCSQWPIVCGAILINGLMYAHLIELQHECMHGHAFNSARLNRLFGVLSGIFMMSSNAHYRYDHLRHHAYLGTHKNLEHFNYRFKNLDSILGFAWAFFDLSRYKRVFYIIWLAIANQPIPGMEKKKYAKEIKQEYVLYAFIFTASVAASIIYKTYLFSLIWWIPVLLISEGVHFMIEMPEHFGLNTQTEPNVLSNTRTIQTSRIVHWFVNGNDLHTAHHYHHGIPMCNVKRLHSLIESQVVVVEKSYRSLYRNILSGRVRHQINGTCMTR